VHQGAALASTGMHVAAHAPQGGKHRSRGGGAVARGSRVQQGTATSGPLETQLNKLC
jgi:hypothetical protein